MSFNKIPSRMSAQKSIRLTRLRNLRYVQTKRLFKRKIQRAFLHMNRDGFLYGIDLEAFKRALSLIEVRASEADVVRIFKHIDLDGNGIISLREFMYFVRTPFDPKDQIRLDISLHVHRPAFFRKYQIWHVHVRPLEFTLVPGPNCIGAYFQESSNPKMYEILDKGSCLRYINTFPVDKINFWDIEQTLENLSCPFNLTFQNLFLPDVVEEWDILGHFKLVRRCLTDDEQTLLKRSNSSINQSGERISHLDLVRLWYHHCGHCPSQMAWYLSIHLLMEDESFSTPSVLMMYFVTFLIFLSTFIYIFETIPGWDEWWVWELLEAIVSILFTLEFTLRVSCCRNVAKYMRDPMNIIDFCAVVPFWLEVITYGSIQPELLRTVRIVRLLRLARLARSKKLLMTINVLSKTMLAVYQWLFMFILFTIIMITIFAAFAFFSESGVSTITGDCNRLSNQTSCSPSEILDSLTSVQINRMDCFTFCEKLGLGGCCSFDHNSGTCDFHQGSSLSQWPLPGQKWTGLCNVREDRYRREDSKPSPFSEIPSSMWWAAATVHMVGYGEIYPLSINGRILGAFSSVAGLLCMAFPLIVLGSNFTAAILIFRYRRVAKESAYGRIGTVGDVLEDMNAIVGEEVFNPDDELVFLVNRLNSKTKLEQILKLKSGWYGLPFATEHIVGVPRISQFKLYALHELYGRRFRNIHKARKKYKRESRSNPRSALRAKKGKRFKNIPDVKTCLGKEPSSDLFEPQIFRMGSLKENSEKESSGPSASRVESKAELSDVEVTVKIHENIREATPESLRNLTLDQSWQTVEECLSREGSPSPSLVLQDNEKNEA